MTREGAGRSPGAFVHPATSYSLCFVISMACSPVWLWCKCVRPCKSCELILKGIPRISFPEEGICDSAWIAADPRAGDCPL